MMFGREGRICDNDRSIGFFDPCGGDLFAEKLREAESTPEFAFCAFCLTSTDAASIYKLAENSCLLEVYNKTILSYSLI
jgi:hypothetical protein